ncbi:MAG TPA: GNAT family N-acetyltransferase [Actinomycetales bacterium]
MSPDHPAARFDELRAGPAIRPKEPRDEAPCLDLLMRVHLSDRYPVYRRFVTTSFLTPPGETAAWVAVLDDGTVVGHVALHDAAPDPTLPAAQRATGLPADRLTVVARLLVSPDARGRGIGSALLHHAAAQARSRGQRAVLDVVQEAPGAVAMYEAAGWRRLEPVVLHLPDGDLALWVYLSPDRYGPSGTGSA